MKKDKNRVDGVNNISVELQKNYKVVGNFSWILVVFSLIIALVLIIFIALYDSYAIKNSELKVEAYSINNKINKEFSLVVNAIEMNGYMNVFEQYLKTSKVQSDVTQNLYYKSASETLNSMSMLNEEVVNTFVVSFNNKSALYSGINNIYVKDFKYENQEWYNFKEIKANRAYVATGIKGTEDNRGELFGIVRPIMDSMNDEPLGVLVYSFNISYLKEFLKEITQKNKTNSILKINEGRILLSTEEVGKGIKDIDFVKEKTQNKWNIYYLLENENLNWNIITYCSIKDIFLNSIWQFALIISLFVLMFSSFFMFINKLKTIRIIRTKREIKEIIDLNKIQNEEMDNHIENIDIEKFEDMPIEEVLNISDNEEIY